MKARATLMRIIFLLKGKIKHIKKMRKRQIHISSEQGWKSIQTFTTSLPMLDNIVSVI